MKLYTDGYTVGSNPSRRGGFVVADSIGKVVVHVPLTTDILKIRQITNNEMELRGVLEAARLIEEFGVISTDSQNTIAWIRNCRCKARPDLKPVAREAANLIINKKITLVWQPRELNLAGIWIENHSLETK